MVELCSTDDIILIATKVPSSKAIKRWVILRKEVRS